MLAAVVSDVHGNLEALDAVCRDGDVRGVDRWICLGDIVGYGPDPETCLARTTGLTDRIVMGNHDAAATGLLDPFGFNDYARVAVEWTANRLSGPQRLLLGQMPMTLRIDDALFVHADPVRPDDWSYVHSLAEASRAIAGFGERLCFIGHTHCPFVCLHDGVGSEFLEHDEGVRLTRDGKYLVNAGSVGQPRDGDARACYVLWDTTAGTLEFVRLPYDVERTQTKMTAAGLPTFLAERLARGY